MFSSIKSLSGEVRKKLLRYPQPSWMNPILAALANTDPAGKRTGFGALLVGFYSGNHLLYAELSALERKTPIGNRVR